MADTLTTITGLTRRVEERPGECMQLYPYITRIERCRQACAELVALDLPHRTARLGYCQAHGGMARIREELGRTWEVAAPDCVGDTEAVYEAGTHDLDSRDVYVHVRPERSRWLAWVGIGSYLEPVPNPEPIALRLSLEGRPRRRHAGARPRGLYAFADESTATTAAVAYWRERLARHIEEIRAQRGGTLAWGLPIQPLGQPIVRVLGEHGSPRDALEEVQSDAR